MAQGLYTAEQRKRGGQLGRSCGGGVKVSHFCRLKRVAIHMRTKEALHAGWQLEADYPRSSSLTSLLSSPGQPSAPGAQPASRGQ